MLPSRQDTFVGLWRKIVENLSTRAGSGMKPSGYDQETDCVSKSTANLGAVYPQGPIGARLRDFVTRTAAVSTQPSPRLPSGYDTEGDLLSKACYNLGGGTPTGSAYDRLYATVQATAATNATLLTGLIAHWKLNETSGTRTDSHGSFDLTANNTIGGTAGKLGNCADFSVGSWLSGDPLPLTGRAVSLSYWVKTPEMVGGYGGYSVPPVTTGVGGYIAASDGGHTPGCPAVDIGYSTGDVRVQGSIPVDDDQWNHVCATCDGTTVKLFINGVLDQTGVAVEGGAFIEGESTRINGSEDFGAAKIKYDSVSFWNRALSAAEITALYNGGAGLDYESFGA